MTTAEYLRGSDRAQMMSYVLAGSTLVLAALVYILFDPVVAAFLDVPSTHGQTEHSSTFVDHMTSIWTWFLLAVVTFFLTIVMGGSIFKSRRGV